MKLRLLPVLATLFCSGRLLAADCTVTVRSTAERGVISPLLFGVNAIYCNEPDEPWRPENIPARLKQIGTALVRYPGGTVTTYYHWMRPTGQGWSDDWDPKFDRARNQPASATLSLDEYLDFTQANGITPLIGVNMGSGKRFARVSDGIAEATALVKHCLARGVHVPYYYLDNEPYVKNANRPFTPEEYAEQINLYAPALKAIAPGIKIIANLHNGVTHLDDVRTVLRRAGAHIDLVDLHFYWRHGHATFANWTAEPRMRHMRGKPYAEQRALYRKLFAEEGFPRIDLVVLEWNIGPHGSGPQPTQAEAALMAAEEFMQFVQSGIPMACFWPLHWEGGEPNRALLNSARGYAPNKVFGMFEQFASARGQMQIEARHAGPAAARVTSVAVRHDNGTIDLYLLNKNQTAAAISLDVSVPDSPFTSVSATGFESTEASAGPLKLHPVRVRVDGSHVFLSLAKNSLAKLTLSRDSREPQRPHRGG